MGIAAFSHTYFLLPELKRQAGKKDNSFYLLVLVYKPCLFHIGTKIGEHQPMTPQIEYQLQWPYCHSSHRTATPQALSLAKHQETKPQFNMASFPFKDLNLNSYSASSQLCEFGQFLNLRLSSCLQNSNNESCITSVLGC